MSWLHVLPVVMNITGDNVQGTRGIVLLERIAGDGGGSDARTPADDASILEDALAVLRSRSGSSSGAVACTSSSGVEIRCHAVPRFLLTLWRISASDASTEPVRPLDRNAGHRGRQSRAWAFRWLSVMGHAQGRRRRVHGRRASFRAEGQRGRSCAACGEGACGSSGSGSGS